MFACFNIEIHSPRHFTLGPVSPIWMVRSELTGHNAYFIPPTYSHRSGQNGTKAPPPWGPLF